MSVDRNMPTSSNITTNVCRLRRGQAPVVTSFLSKSTWLRTQAHSSPFDRFRVPNRIFTQQKQSKKKCKECVFFCAEKLLFDLLHTELMPGVPYFPF